MAHLALFALLRLISEDRNLLSLAVLQDLACNGSALNIRGADFCSVFAANCNDRERNCLVFIGSELLNVDHVAVLYLVLLTAGFNNCKHFFCLPFL